MQGSLGIDTSHGIWLLGQKTAADPSVFIYNHNLPFLTSRIYLYRPGKQQWSYSVCPLMMHLSRNHGLTFSCPLVFLTQVEVCAWAPSGTPTAVPLPSHLRWGTGSEGRWSRAQIHSSETVNSSFDIFRISEIAKHVTVFLGRALMLLIQICRSEDSCRDNDKADAKIGDRKHWEAPKTQTDDTDADKFVQGHTGTLGQKIMGKEPGLRELSPVITY